MTAEELEFKYVVDGNWTTSEDYPTTEDKDGNLNNVLYLAEIAAEEALSQYGKTSSAAAAIPESGGLPVPVQGSSVNTTVLPSQEGKQQTLPGEAGIFVPSNPHEIDAFNEVSNVDAKELNAKLNGEKTAKEQTDESEKPELKTTVMPSEEGQQKTLAGEPGVVIPSDAHNISAFSEYSTVDPKALNEEMQAQKEQVKQEVSEPKTRIREVVKKSKLTGEETVIHREEAPESQPAVDSEAPPSSSAATGTNTSKETTSPKTTKAAAVTAADDSLSATAAPSEKPKKEKKGFLKRFKNIIK